tara:strand:+ start:4875 stop:5621 length:747 start_codon:yes stop_codon:yes gene_type:complete
MKIAMTISGQPRRYKHGFKELKKWFLDKYDIDVYLHAWQDKEFHKYNFFNEGKLEKVYHIKENMYDDLLEFYQPKSYLFEKSIKFDATDIKGPNNQRLNSQMGMWMSLKRAWDLVEESGKKYDLYIRTRYDLLFTHNVANNCPFLTDITKLDPSKLNYFAYPSGMNTVAQLNDYFAVGGYEVMKTYHNVFPNMLYTQFYDKNFENEYGDRFINETLLYYHLNQFYTPLNGILSGFENRGKDGGPQIMR